MIDGENTGNGRFFTTELTKNFHREHNDLFYSNIIQMALRRGPFVCFRIRE